MITSLIFLLFLLFLGLIMVLSPLSAMRVLMRWPKFIFPRLFHEDKISTLAKDAMTLIDDEKQYKKHFWYQLLLLRISGFIAIIISFIGLLMIWVEVSP